MASKFVGTVKRAAPAGPGTSWAHRRCVITLGLSLVLACVCVPGISFAQTEAPPRPVNASSAAPTAPAATADPALFRIFLKDGTALASYGEFARVGERVVFTLPLGEGRQQLATVGAADVDWPRTDTYAYAVRASTYAASRGEAEFADMSVRVASTLTEIARGTDPVEQLRLAHDARRELAEWPMRHFGYRADEIRETLGVLDEVIAGLRAKTTRTRFDINLVAAAVPPSPVPLLTKPTLRDSIAQALRLATMAESPAERVELLRGASAALDADPTARTEEWATSARAEMRETIEAEESTDRAYAALATRTLSRAERGARRADVRSLTNLRRDLLKRDARLGGRRPQQVAALLAALDARLDAAQRLRLAQDRWALKSDAFRSYRRAIGSALDLLRRADAPLHDIRAPAGPSTETLADLSRRFDRLQPGLRTVTVPSDLQSAHASLISAWHLATAAVRQRQKAIADNDMTLARNASAAAAGALMLAERVQTEIATILEGPRLP